MYTRKTYVRYGGGVVYHFEFNAGIEGVKESLEGKGKVS